MTPSSLTYCTLEQCSTEMEMSDFDCGLKPLNKFTRKELISRNKDRKHKAFVAMDGNKLAAYITFTTKEIEADKNTFGYKAIPVLMVEQLATDNNYKKKGVASTLMAKAFEAAVKVSEVTGLYGVALWSHPDAEQFYKSLGFISLEVNPIDNTVLMFLSIDVIIDSLSQ